MVAQRDFVCGCLGASGKAELEDAGWRTWGDPDPRAVVGGSSMGSLISHNRERRDGKSQTAGCCALTSPPQKPVLSQTSCRSPNLPVLKTLPIKWDDNCVLHNCRHGPEGTVCCCCSAPSSAEPAPRAREIIRILHINKNIITSLCRGTMNTHCKPHHTEHLLQRAGEQQAIKAFSVPEEIQTLSLYGGQMPLGGLPPSILKRGF